MSGNRFVRKLISYSNGLYEEIANVLLFLHERSFPCPQPVETKDGYVCDTVTANEMTAEQTPVEESYTLRVFVFIRGELMINYLPKTPLLYYKYGQALGKLNHLTMSLSYVSFMHFVYTYYVHYSLSTKTMCLLGIYFERPMQQSYTNRKQYYSMIGATLSMSSVVHTAV